jgi:hypothetical protein
MGTFLSIVVLLLIALAITGFVLYKINTKIKVFGIPLVMVLGVIGIGISVISFVIIQRTFGNKKNLIEELKRKLDFFHTKKEIELIDNQTAIIDDTIKTIDNNLVVLDSHREENAHVIERLEKEKYEIIGERAKIEEYKHTLEGSLEERVNAMNNRLGEK